MVSPVLLIFTSPMVTGSEPGINLLFTGCLFDATGRRADSRFWRLIPQGFCIEFAGVFGVV
jgi:hypothetical protein